MDIDFWVWPGQSTQPTRQTHIQNQLTGPDEKVMHKKIRQSTGSVSITAETNGRYEYCFSNQMSAIADKVVRYAPLSPFGWNSSC